MLARVGRLVDAVDEPGEVVGRDLGEVRDITGLFLNQSQVFVVWAAPCVDGAVADLANVAGVGVAMDVAGDVGFAFGHCSLAILTTHVFWREVVLVFFATLEMRMTVGCLPV